MHADRLSQALEAWFAEHRRDLPWRTDRTPYRVWLSEVMLQQTRVSVVEDYFLRFVARFPDVRALAAASEDEVLSLWSGLGYYSRGRNLHRAAQLVVRDHGGSFPATASGLAALPGVGPYTAAAVASLAFGERAAVLDGNVARVVARVTNDDRPVDDAAGRARTLAVAQALVDAGRSGAAVNEGLMELGAVVCTPRSPSCLVCPWRDLCAGRAAGRAEQLPKKAPKSARKAMHVASVVVVDGARVWLEKRHERGLFGGLYAPPSRTLSSSAVGGDAGPTARTVRAAWRELLVERGLAVPDALPAARVVERALTHRDLTFHVARVEVGAAEPRAAGAWFEDVSSVGTSTAVRAVLAAALD